MYTRTPTGVGVYTREVWNRLYKKLDLENVEYVCCTYNKSGLNKPQKLISVKLPFVLEYLLRKFISVHRLLWNLFWLPFVAKDYELVYSFSSHGSPFVKNQIITIHDLICFTFPKQHKFQFLYFKYILPLIVKVSVKIVVVSEFTKSEVVRHYKVDPNKVIVIANGGDHLINSENDIPLSDEEKKLGNSISDKKFFLTVGASYSHKNVERLIMAMDSVCNESSLVIVGVANSYYKKLKRLAKQNKRNNIFFLDYVSSGLLSLLYKKCIANVYISLYEGFGFPPLEAALLNNVSLISNTGALPEIYRDAAYYVNPVDIKEIAEALTFMMSSNFPKQEYREKFPDLINKYKWSITADKIAQLIFCNERFKPVMMLKNF